MTQESPGLRPIYLGRTPILDRNRVPIGYEFFCPENRRGGGMVASAFPADVVFRMFAELGLANVLGSHRAFVAVDDSLFAQGVVELVKERNVVFELDCRRPLSAQALAVCRELHRQGREFCVAGIGEDDAGLDVLLPLARYLRADTRQLSPQRIAQLPARFGGVVELMAAGIDTDETFRLCRDAGYRLFRGYFFARATILRGRRLDAAVCTVFCLLRLLDAGADEAQLEAVLKSDPGLSINLLRLTNAVAALPGVRVDSIRRALVVLGREQLRRWLQLLVFTNKQSAASVRRNPLMQLAALRANFMEVLAARCFSTRREMRDQAFLTGLISLMPAALDMRMVDVLSSVTVSPEVRRALSRREGELGALLDLTESFDADDSDATDAALARLGARFDASVLGDCLGEAIARVEALESAISVEPGTGIVASLPTATPAPSLSTPTAGGLDPVVPPRLPRAA